MSEPSGTPRAETVGASDSSAEQTSKRPGSHGRNDSTVTEVPSHNHEASPSDTPPSAADPGSDAEPHSDRETPYFWLRRSDQFVLGVLLTAALVLMVVHWVRLSGWGLKPVEIDRQPLREFSYRIDVNQAAPVELAQLAGIGEVLASRIVEDRRQNGPFESIADLQRVKGIGPKTVDKIRPWLRVGPNRVDASRNAN